MSSLALNRDTTRVLRTFRACQTKQIESIGEDEMYYSKSDKIATNKQACKLSTGALIKDDENSYLLL